MVSIVYLRLQMTFGIELSRHGSHLSQRRVQSNFNFEASGDLASRSSCLHVMSQWPIFPYIITLCKRRKQHRMNQRCRFHLFSSFNFMKGCHWFWRWSCRVSLQLNVEALGSGLMSSAKSQLFTSKLQMCDAESFAPSASFCIVCTDSLQEKHGLQRHAASKAEVQWMYKTP